MNFFLLFLASTVLSFVPVEKNYETVIVNKGGGTVLKCTTVKEALGCSFISPKGKNYNMLRDAAYEQGRIQQEELNYLQSVAEILLFLLLKEQDFNAVPFRGLARFFYVPRLPMIPQLLKSTRGVLLR